MRPPKPFPADTAAKMQALLKTVTSLHDQRRIQAVLMRALHASTPAQISAVTGLTLNTVRIIHSRYLSEGESFLVNRPGRGGRRRAHLSESQVQALLQRHVDSATKGQVIVADEFKRDYEKLAGHPVAASSVYRLLAKAGWRKIVPRPSHPKKDSEAESAFKKSLPR
jgi:transposase